MRILIPALVTLALLGGCSAQQPAASTANPMPSSPAAGKYVQTWTKGYDQTTCGDWLTRMTSSQQFAMAADVLSSARNKLDGGTGLPSDALVANFQRNISSGCEPEASLKVLEVSYYVYNYDGTFKP